VPNPDARRFPSSDLDSFQACDNLTSVKSPNILHGKIVMRLASKSFGQGYFCMSLLGSSSAEN
jgi:hypothetical protein